MSFKFNTTKKILSLLLSTALLVSSISVSAADTSVENEGGNAGVEASLDGVTVTGEVVTEDTDNSQAQESDVNAEKNDSDSVEEAASVEKAEGGAETDTAANGPESQDKAEEENSQLQGDTQNAEEPGHENAADVSEESSQEPAALEETAETAEPEAAEILVFEAMAKDGTVVRAKAPAGTFPEGTEMTVKVLPAQRTNEIVTSAMEEDGYTENDSYTVKTAIGLDITFTFEGKEIEPDGDVTVEFVGRGIGSDVNVVHVTDNDSIEFLDVEKGDDGVVVTTDAFSEYVVYEADREDLDDIYADKSINLSTIGNVVQDIPKYNDGSKTTIFINTVYNKEPVVTVHDSRFKEYRNHGTNTGLDGRDNDKYYLIEYDALPAGTTQYNNVLTVETPGIAYTADGTEVDLVYNLDWVQLQKVAGDKNAAVNDSNGYYNGHDYYVGVAATGRPGNAFDLVHAHSRSGPLEAFLDGSNSKANVLVNVKEKWTVSAYIAGTKTLVPNGILYTQFRDIDIVKSDGSQYTSDNPKILESKRLPEAIYFADGWKSTWLDSTSNLAHENNGSYVATKETDASIEVELRTSAVGVASDSPRVTFYWTGSRCDTTVSFGSFDKFSPVNGYPQKAVDKKEAAIGDTITYTFKQAYPKVDDVSHFLREAYVSDTFDAALDMNTFTYAVKNREGKDVTEHWKMEKNGQTVKFSLLPEKFADAIGEEFTFTVSTKIKDIDYTDHINIAQKLGVTDAQQIPASYVKNGSTYAQIPNRTFSHIVDYNGNVYDGYSKYVATSIPVDSIVLVKDVDKTSISNVKAGDVLQYSFSIKNNGHATLHNVQIEDKLDGIQDLRIDWNTSTDKNTGEGILSVGESVKATARYTVTEEFLSSITDKIPYTITNTATAKGTDDNNNTVSSTDDAKTVVADIYIPLETPSIALSKKADKTNIPGAKVGDVINYTFEITNDGFAVLNDVKLVDKLSGVTGLAIDWNGSTDPKTESGVLSVGEVVTATAKYVVKQSDIDAGSIVNPATATGVDKYGTEVSADDSVKTTLSQTADIAIEKTVDKESLKNVSAGEPLNYTVTVTNTGNSTLKSVTITDEMLEKAGVKMSVKWPGDKTGELAPGEKAIATAMYHITDADIKAGKVTNVAVASAKDTSGKDVGPVNDDAVTKVTNASLKISKSVDKAVVENAKPGDTVTYTMTIENASNVTLNNVTLSDEMLEKAGTAISVKWPAEEGILKPGEKAVATAVYALTQADIDAGKLDNIATATAKDPDGDTVGPVKDNAETKITWHPELAVDKQVDKTKLKNVEAGEPLEYTVVITNTGNVTIHNIKAVDEMLDGAGVTLSFTWPTDMKEVLAPGEKATASAVYNVTGEDIESAEIINTVIVNGDDPGNEPVPPVTDTVRTVVSNPQITISKNVDKRTLKNVIPGDKTARLTYSIDIYNDGNVPLTDVELVDEMLEDAGIIVDIEWPGEPGLLGVGEMAAATAVYPVSWEDVEKGSVYNEASVTAMDPEGEPVGPVEDADETKIINEPGAELVKTADVTLIKDAKPGMVINYTLTGKNTGYTVLKNVEIKDELEGISDLAFVWPGETGVLKPSEVVTAKASYAITQDDINRGKVLNTAIMTDPDVEIPPVTVTTDIEQDPAISITKTTDEPILTDAKAGDTVTWYFEGENIGNVDLHDVFIEDELEGISELAYTWPGEANVLKVGEKVTATASYVLTQEDVDTERNILNTAVIKGYAPVDPDDDTPKDPVTDTDTAETSPVAVPGVAIQKDVDKKLIEDGRAGDQVNYSFTITNTGNTTLYNVVMQDEMLDNVTDVVLDWSSAKAEGEMLPGQVVKGTAVYTLTQDDIDAGDILNVAVVHAEDPSGEPVDPARDDAKTDITQHPELTVKKTVDKDIIIDGTAGDTVDYTIVAANTGNVTLKDVRLTDEMLSDAGVELSLTWPSETAGTLAPGEKVIAKAVYTLTQEDIDRGEVLNAVIANANDPNDEPVPPAEDKTRTVIEQNPEITVEKTVDKEFVENGKPGDELTYTVTVTNTGNVTASNIKLTDEMLADAGVELPVKFPEGREVVLFPAGKTNYLRPGEKATATAVYKLTQEDIDMGEVANVVVANADDPSGEPIPPVDDDARTDIEQYPEIAVEKTVDKEVIENGRAGDEVTYTVTVTNTGNVTASNVRLTDEMLAGAGVEMSITWPGDAEGVLAPGEKAVATAVYVLTQEDIDRGEVTNVVVANADDPNGDPIPPVDSEVKTDIEQTPSLVLTKDVDIKTLKDPEIGQPLTYTITITNNGNVTVRNIVVTDKLIEYAGLDITFTWPEGKTAELAPGETAVMTATYGITQADIDRGAVNNTVIATGNSPKDTPVDPEPATARTEIRRTPGLAVTKEVDKTNIDNARPGDKLTYTFTIENTGNTTLVNVALNDDLKGLSDIKYNWKEYDGSVKREFVLDKDTLTYHFACSDIADIGDDDIEFFYCTVGEVKEMDSPVNLFYGTTEEVENMGYRPCSKCSPDANDGVLLPGEKVTATAVYSITEADIRKGKVVNTVFASGSVPANDPEKTPEPVKSNTAKVTTTLHAPAVKAPKTGDSGNAPLWFTSLIMAAALLMFISYMRKRVK